MNSHYHHHHSSERPQPAKLEEFLLLLQFCSQILFFLFARCYYCSYCHFNCVWHALSNVEKHDFSPPLSTPLYLHSKLSSPPIHPHTLPWYSLLFIFLMHLFSYSFLSAVWGCLLYSVKNVATRLKKSLWVEVDLRTRCESIRRAGGVWEIYDIFYPLLFLVKVVNLKINPLIHTYF